MKKHTGKGLISLALALALLFSLLPTTAFAAEGGSFVLVAEAGGKLVIPPESISYTPGQSLGEALAATSHSFVGLEEGIVTAIDGVVGNFTRSDQTGGYDLAQAASNVTHFRFSEETSSAPSEGLLLLMTAMAAYLDKTPDTQAAAREAYRQACDGFVGIDSDSARTLAAQLNAAMDDYESSLSGTLYSLSFRDGSKLYSEKNYPGVSISVENAYGRVWQDAGEGSLSLPAGSYTFCLEQEGLRVEGSVNLSGAATVTVSLPKTPWLTELRLSGSYGADDNEDHRFTDGEFTLGAWKNRQVTVPVPDTFTGAVYACASYDTKVLSSVPTLTASYTSPQTGLEMEKELAFDSLNSGAYAVLAQGAQGNRVTYRISSQGKGGYTYSQDYWVDFERIPTLKAITLTDGDGTGLAATSAFDPGVTDYTYKVLDTVTAVTIQASPMAESYAVTVNGQNAAEGVTVPVSGPTEVSLVVSAGDYTNPYTLTIQPGAGKSLSFVSDKDVTVEVVNSNGVVMPYKTYKETATQNNYKYTLVPGEVYSYIATYKTHYHMADEFSLEEVANSRITVDFSGMEDWLQELAFGTKEGKTYKGTLPVTPAFTPATHSYDVSYVDTEHIAYVWATGKEGVTITASYNQLFNSSLYHGKEKTLTLTSGNPKGERLKRFLMDENPLENAVTIRLAREVDGVTWYQDYEVMFRRSLTLGDLTARVDGMDTTLTRENGATGFDAHTRDYTVTVSMAAKELNLAFTRYTDNTCYGETEVGYRVLVDGVDATQTDSATIAFNGTLETQVVTVTVENDKAPAGTGTYRIHIQKSPPVAAQFDLQPLDGVLTLHETLSGERLWPENGSYLLCEGYSYAYTFTNYGYVGQSGTLRVTRDEGNNLVVTDGDTSYPVTQDGENGGIVTISWALSQAQPNGSLQTGLSAQWPNFRGNAQNNGVTDSPIPTTAQSGTLYWANQIGSGFDSDAVGSPILVNGELITYAGSTIYRIDTLTGQIKKTGQMDHKSSYAITPPTYSGGMVFVALSNGTVQAFDAVSLESLWIYVDPLGGQPNCPMTVKDGYLYTGFWSSETGKANFVCLSITDEDPGQAKERKNATWYYTSAGGFYWAGAYVGDNFLLVGTDDGTNGYRSQTGSLLCLDPKTGRLLDRWSGLNGDVRSTVVRSGDSYYFTSKGGTFYSVQVTQDGKLSGKWSLNLRNGTGGVPMSTCSPVVYNGRAYVGVSGAGQFSAYSGHNITVIDLASRSIAYSVPTQGYPQTSGLLTTYYDDGVYVYFFDNMTPGKLRVLRDKPGQTAGDYLTQEGELLTAYALFTPTGDQAQYAICSPITDEYGTIYFKNDSAYLMAFGSTITELQVTTMPDKTEYQAGETFDPAGMTITAVYANGKTRDVTAYVSWPEGPLTVADREFTLSCPYGMYQNQEEGAAMNAGVPTLTPTVQLTLTVTSGIPGDANGDGKVDKLDAQAILDYEAGLMDNLPNPLSGDVSGDGVVDSNDAVLILQLVDGLISAFPEAQ